MSESYTSIIFDTIHLIFQIFYLYLSSFYYFFVGKPKVSVESQLIVITGAGHGLGREIALQLSSLGAKIVLLDIQQTDLQNVTNEIISTGGYAKSFICDVSDEKIVYETVRTIEEEIGPIDMIINNAGITHALPLLQISFSEIRKTFEVNTLAHFWLIKAVLPNMINRNKGRIVAISSIAGLLGTANIVDYCSSKYAVIGLMEALRRELRELNADIKLTTICPVSMNTGMFKSPKSRFDRLIPIYSASHVAKFAVDAILNDSYLITVPKSIKWLHAIKEFVPLEVTQIVQDFLSYGVDSHVTNKKDL